jgi:hypothetical protein
VDTKTIVIGAAGAILPIIAVLMVSGAQNVAVSAFLLPNMHVWTNVAYTIVPSLMLLLLGVVLLKYGISEPYLRISFWSGGALFALVLVLLLKIPWLFAAMLVGTALGAYLPLSTNDPCKRGIWKTITAPKSFGALVVFVIAYLVASANPQALQADFENAIVSLTLKSLSGNGAQTLDVHSIISPEVTPAERQQLIQRIEAETPNWNQLTPEQQQALIDNYIKAYSQTKKIIYETLAQNIHVPDERTMEETVRNQLESMPILKSLEKYLPALAGITVTIYYTLVEFVAELVALVFGLIIYFALGRKPATQN